MPIRSMTGYAQAVREDEDLRITVEMRSVNNRFADVRLRLPGDLQSMESGLRRRVVSVVRRGRVDVAVVVERLRTRERAVRLNLDLVARLASAAELLKTEQGMTGNLDVATALGMPGVVETAEQEPGWDDGQRALVEEAVDAALAGLDAERIREGEALCRDLLERVTSMLGLAEQVAERAPRIVTELQRKLGERVAALTQGVELDPGRLAQEVALLADRADVAEELVRLRGHLGQAHALLAEPDGEPVGKRMDFLLQEILRETNTINSKSPDLEMSRLALALKLETERVREQTQNLE